MEPALCSKRGTTVETQLLGIPGSTCHYRKVELGSKPIHDLKFLAIVISVIIGVFTISQMTNLVYRYFARKKNIAI
jgi:hypothetical protein